MSSANGYTPSLSASQEAPEVIFFDLWRTLVLSHNKRPIHALQVMLGHRVIGPGGCPCDEPDPRLLRLCDTVNISDPVRFLQHAAGTVGVWHVTDEAVNGFLELLQQERNCCAQYKDVLPTLKALKERGYRLGLISNAWPFPVEQIFFVDGLAEYFEHLVFSFEVGHIKPEPEIFEEACRRFGVEPGRCLMVGDSVEADIKGALNAGMKAALIDRPGEVTEQIPGVRKMRSLTELLEILPSKT